MHIAVHGTYNVNGTYNDSELVLPVEQLMLIKETKNGLFSYKVKGEGFSIHVTETEYDRIKEVLVRVNMYEVDRFNAIQKEIDRGSIEQIGRREISALMGIELNDD
jgi:hypothetical protein